MLAGPRVRRLALGRLERTIARAVAADAGRAIAPLLTVPAEATDPSLARTSVEAFTLMDAPHGRWYEPDLGQPVVYQVDAGGDAALGPTASLAAVDGAMAAWSNVTGATITLARGGNAQPGPLVCDGVSQLIFNDAFHEMPDPTHCSGILALGG